MKWKKTKRTENQGILYVQDQVNKQGSIYRPVHQEADVGIDGFIEFVIEEEVTGLLIAVQIKSGDSYLNEKGDAFALSIDRHHIEYWLSFHLPVYVIFYSPSLNKAAYTSIKGYVEREKYHDRLPVRKIDVPLRNAFDAETISDDFPLLVNTFRDEKILLKCVEECLTGTSVEKAGSFQILANHPKSRDRKVTFYMASKLLMHENIATAKKALYILGYGIGRFRWSWNPNNEEEKDLISFSREMVSCYSTEQVERIIELIEDEDFHGPHALGERAYDTLVAVGLPARETLYSIMCDPSCSMKQRLASMYILYNRDYEMIYENREELLSNVNTKRVFLKIINDMGKTPDSEEHLGPTLFD